MFSDKVILSFAKRYTSNITSVELLGVSHNTVYKVNSDDPFIFRVTLSHHRSYNELMGELNFISFLHNNGAHVAFPLQSLKNELVTRIQFNNEFLLLTAFNIAEGLQWHERADIHYLKYIGRELGRIHKCSRNYNDISETPRRQYFENQHLVNAFDVFEKYSMELHMAYRLFLEILSQLPKNAGNYGLIHGDFLMSNYNITTQNLVTVYDFDECEYSWYISDIATLLYYCLTGGDPSRTTERADEATTMIFDVMSGYLAENDLPVSELKNIELFFKLRDCVLLSTIIGRRDKILGWWDALLVPMAIDRVVNNKPFINVDYDLIINKLIATYATVKLCKTE